MWRPPAHRGPPASRNAPAQAGAPCGNQEWGPHPGPRALQQGARTAACEIQRVRTQLGPTCARSMHAQLRAPQQRGRPAGPHAHTAARICVHTAAGWGPLGPCSHLCVWAHGRPREPLCIPRCSPVHTVLNARLDVDVFIT